MKLATLREGGRDGTLIVVDRQGRRFRRAAGVVATLQGALDAWQAAEPGLRALSEELAAGEGEALDLSQLAAPLPRAYEWVDGSAYINHILLVRKARNASPPATLETEPLVYQGGSGVLLGPRDPIALVDPSWGLDFESEICAILGDTPLGTSREAAPQQVKLLMLANDVTLRNLVPAELAKGFGFFHSKPATAFSPFAVTPDELGDAWRGGRVHLPLLSHLNGELAGDPYAGDAMHFSFYDLVAHIAKTRALTAGTILGSGTVSNDDPARGVSCLAERRMRELISEGKASTEFLTEGDVVRIEMLDKEGCSVFGAIEQQVVAT